MTDVPEAAPGTATRGVEPRSPVVAVAASTVVHVCLAAILVTVGVTAARAMRPEPAPVLVADWTPPPPPGVMPPPPELPVPGGAPNYVGPAGRGKASPAAAAAEAAARLARLVPPPTAAGTGTSERLAGGLGFDAAIPKAFRAESFAMDRSRVAFVVDAGGRLLGAMPAARAVLAQRLSALAPNQRFTLAVARGGAVELAPNTPAAATQANVLAALRWFTERATADLGAALDRVWQAMEPDAVCIVARGTPATRRIAARAPTDGLLAVADRLNPARTDGSRAARLLCIELADASADGALRTLGERQGGPTGYLFIDRRSLGMVAAPPRAVPAATTGRP
jgi:hypothetical protein